MRRLVSILLMGSLLLLVAWSSSPGGAQPRAGTPCVLLISLKLGDQRPLLEQIKAVRSRLGLSLSEIAITEIAMDNPIHRKVILDVLHLKEHQLPLASTGELDSNGLPTRANKNRPALALPHDVIAYYLLNECGRRVGKGPYPWPYQAPPAEPTTLEKSRLNPMDGSQLLLVPGGEFWRGSTEGEIDELPPQRVQHKAVYVGKTEVTVGQFAHFVAETGYQTEAEQRGFGFVWQGDWSKVEGANWWQPDGHGQPAQDEEPVRQVSLNDCQAYCAWAGLRLPSEAEWEKAARGTGGRQYPWGANWDAGKSISSGQAPRRVGSLPTGASPYGLLDMAGNVREWTSSVYQPYSDKIEDDTSGKRYSVRGGSFAEDNPRMAHRTSYRFHSLANLPNNLTGFRVACDPGALGQLPLQQRLLPSTAGL
jgi:sulfatase modifying factor 1